MSEEQYVVTDAEGIPSSVVDVEQLRGDAKRLAWELAAHADDAEAVGRLLEAARVEWGDQAMGWLCAGALRVMATDVVSGLFDITDAIGAPVRAKLAELAARR